MVYIAAVINKIEVRCKMCGGTGRVSVIDFQSLRHARSQAGISLRELARQLGLSAPYISDIELGRRACPLRVEQAYRNLETLNRKESNHAKTKSRTAGCRR